MKLFRMWSDAVSSIYVVTHTMEEAVQVWRDQIAMRKYGPDTPAKVEYMGEVFTA
jgi:ABC-type nitrate/sulfonate/bicarbonate transport system ATPase subunit